MLADEVDDSFSILVIHYHLQLHLGQKLHPVITGPPLQGDALLPAPALDLAHSHSRKALTVQLATQKVQLFRPNYGFNLLHFSPTLHVSAFAVLADVQAHRFFIVPHP